MKITLDRAAIARVLAEPLARQAIRRKAAEVVATARDTGPRGSHRGAHRIDKIVLGETRSTLDGAETDVDWRSSFWHIVEFGSVNNRAYRVVTRSAENAGLTVRDRRR